MADITPVGGPTPERPPEEKKPVSKKASKENKKTGKVAGKRIGGKSVKKAADVPREQIGAPPEEKQSTVFTQFVHSRVNNFKAELGGAFSANPPGVDKYCAEQILKMNPAEQGPVIKGWQLFIEQSGGDPVKLQEAVDAKDTETMAALFPNTEDLKSAVYENIPGNEGQFVAAMQRYRK